MVVVSCAEPENSARGRSLQGFSQFFFSANNVFHRMSYQGLSIQTERPWPYVPPSRSNRIASRGGGGGSVPVFLKNHTALCFSYFPGGWGSGHTHTPDHERLLRVLRRRLFMRYLFQARLIGPYRSVG